MSESGSTRFRLGSTQGSPQGWRQVWEDIRHALREPDAEGDKETRGQGEGETAGGEEIALRRPEPFDPSVELGAGSAQDMQGSTEAEEFAAREGGGTGRPGDQEIDEVTQQALPLSPSPPLPVTHARWIPAVLAVGLVALAGLFLLRSRLPSTQAQPPAPNVVATYDGGQITLEDVRQHLALLLPDERLQQQFQDVQDYRLVVQEMITDELVRRWAAERKADRDENFQHVMKHITENITLDELHAQMHQGQMGVTAGEIQAYYQANREQFGDQTLTQVRDQIRTTLQAQQEDQFVEDYINRLKENATITRDFALLEVPEPEERELKAYYEANREQYVVPAQAVVDEIRIPVGKDEAAAQEKANKVLVRLRSGEDFVTVAADLSETPFSEQGTTIRKGQRDTAYDEAVFGASPFGSSAGLDEGQISDVFRAGDDFYVVRLRSIQPERQQSLDEVREQVRQAVLAEKEATWFQENADRTLLTIHGERYTAGEFWQEYQELPLTFLADYQGAEGRKALAERLIERLLLVEDSYDQLLNARNKGEIEEVRLEVLAQMMEQEEVDDRIEVTDEELQAYYEEHKAEMVGPPQARIRYIMIRLGQMEDERKRAWDKANEAHKKLVPGLFKEGADFAEVVRQYSEDEATASKGGEMEGWIGEGPDLLAELTEHPFHQQILSLREGEISHPFEWNGAIYIVQVLERKEPRPLPFEEAKELLREELRLQKHDELTVQLSQKLLKQANVTIYDQTLPTLVEQPGPD